MATHTINAEIFSTGVWNGDKFTLSDLEEIAANFNLVSGEVKPPLKLGHTENQQLLDQADGQPALGWVSALTVQSEKLVATFTNVPTVVKDAIQSGLYRRVSAEIYYGFKQGKNKLGKVLKAVALLGADIPAVDTLADLTALMSADARENTGDDCEVIAFTIDKPIISEVNNMSAKQEIEAMPPVSTPPIDTQELADLRLFKRDAEKELSKAKIIAEEKEIRESARKFTNESNDIIGKFDELVKAGQVMPTIRDEIAKEIESQSVNFTSDSKVSLSAGIVLKLFTKISDKLPQGETAHVGESEGVGKFADEQLANAAKKYTAEHPEISYVQAVDIVTQANPELNAKYGAFALEEGV